jgi:hypothetical protein
MLRIGCILNQLVKRKIKVARTAFHLEFAKNYLDLFDLQMNIFLSNVGLVNIHVDLLLPQPGQLRIRMNLTSIHLYLLVIHLIICDIKLTSSFPNLVMLKIILEFCEFYLDSFRAQMVRSQVLVIITTTLSYQNFYNAETQRTLRTAEFN